MWQGTLNLTYAKHQDATRLIKAYSKAPLKIQRSFYPEGEDICHNVILHTAGGMVGGDRLEQSLYLQPETHAFVTTAAASKVYRSNGLTAKQTANIQLDRLAYLEYLPQPTIVFNGAIYHQDLRVELATDASWLGWEITRFGRSARGEKFLQGEWRSHTEVWQNQQPLWIDRQWLPAGEELWYGASGLAAQPIVASLCWLGQPVSKEIVENARKLWEQRDTQGEAGVTQLICGLLCRYRGASTTDAIGWFTQIWQLLRLTYRHRSVTLPRIWQT
jgi:urease accessory protein